MIEFEKFSIAELFNETHIRIFAIVEFLNVNGLQVAFDENCPYFTIPEVIYNMVWNKADMLHTLARLRTNELDSKIDYISQEILYYADKNGLKWGQDVDSYNFLLNELENAKATSYLRDNLDDTYKQGDDDDNEYNDYEPPINNEYEEFKIYNSSGFVTSAFGLNDAIAKVENFGGEAISKQGKCVYKRSGYITNRNINPWE